ncbi:ABC transporter substrate-binding protein [Variovorax arabinosiphilus]|uniref:ABC transporter substrate-binding protein n=1 Tax=Variovorax arabinosiphilus TaxID=3053498 RepID=UPI0025767274|nr:MULTISPECIES: ABC transporter substrate-binding protein [unclassified Variovorax]MDM0120793.1 ABC transporter substrate-binding protein [Variovorax sp. J2L1-78]MDM0127295.1 ABC transporter substrate-binding protein [Variovorax sp. J2L1-63]MDM0236173.1 ABC transporter substrate-binding protein [Variovorax sp. J2R1-6]
MTFLRTLALGALVAGATLAAQAQTLPERIAKTKTIKIAVNAIYPPMEYKDPESGKLIGFDVDLGNALAKELGVTLEWQEAAFEQLIPSLQTGRVDMILSGLNDRPARRETMDFVDYLHSGVQFYTLASRSTVNQPLDLCGKTVGTSRSTAFPAEIKTWSDANCVAAGKPAITVEGTSDNAAARAQLKQERFEGGAQGSETVPYAMTLEPGIYKPLGAPFGGAQQGIAFAKADTQLRDAVLTAFKKLIADGTYASIVAKWKLQASAVKQAAVNGVAVP